MLSNMQSRVILAGIYKDKIYMWYKLRREDGNSEVKTQEFEEPFARLKADPVMLETI